MFIFGEVYHEQHHFQGGNFKSNKQIAVKECEALIKKLPIMVVQMNKDKKMDMWLHMPKTSFEHHCYMQLCKIFEAMAYSH